jgi:hypothetical protein
VRPVPELFPERGVRLMKVLKPGVTVDWSAELACTGNGNGGGGCGAVLLVEEADLFLTSAETFHFTSPRYVTFRCVICGTESDVEHVPERVLQRLPNKAAWERRHDAIPPAHEQTEARSWPPPLGAEGAESGGGAVM